MKLRLKNEWRLFIRAPASVLLLGVLAILTMVAAGNGTQRLLQERITARQALAEDRESFAAKRKALEDLEAGRAQEGQVGSPRKAHQAILSARRPLVPNPAELPVLSSGTRPTPELLAVSILTRHVDQQPRLDDPSNRLDGPFDLVFVVTWLLPLFALVLGCDVISGDRERGSATLLASQGTSLRRIMAKRLLVRFWSLFAVVATGSLVVVLISERTNLGNALPALALWMTGLAVYLGFWLALAALVNVHARSAASAALALLGIWIAVAVASPALSGSVVQALAPPPDRLQGVLALRDIDADLNRRRREVTNEYYSRSPQNRPIAAGDEFEHYFVTELYPRHLAFDRAYAPIAARMDEARTRQARLMRVAGVFSPTLSFRLLTEDLAGLAPERRVTFFEAVDSYQDRWRDHFDHKLASMRPLTLSDYDSKPDFHPVGERALSRWGRIALILATLLLPGFAAIGAALRRSRRLAPFGTP
jgi:ABC-2 type transport system permease protein